MQAADWKQLLLKPSLNWLLILVPVTMIVNYGFKGTETLTFILACGSVIPLAAWMGRATEHLAERTSEGVGGLLNATFGNAAELIIALVALKAGKIDIVKASLTGSIIGNILLVLGAALLAGGLKNREQKFNSVGAHAQSTLLTLAAVALLIPAVFHHSLVATGHESPVREHGLSLAIGLILIVTYGLGLLFSLKTHKHLFAGHGHSVDEDAGADHKPGHPGTWPVWAALTVLGVATALIAWISEILVHTVEHAGHAMGMNNVFVGVIVVAVIGNAAEHSTAILMAMKNRMDLALGIAIGSSIQIALFVAPVLLFAGHFMGTPFDLVFHLPEVLAVVAAVAITGQIATDGRSNWLEGMLLLAVYVILALMFFYLPMEPVGPEHVPAAPVPVPVPH